MQADSGPPQVVSSVRLAQWERGISASADRVADLLARQKYIGLLLFSSLYLLATCFRASRKLFWFDELFTLYVSRLPDMASVWSALKGGADFNPPFFYAVIRASESLLGEGHIATRLPAILGFWICCLCLFRFVSVRTTVVGGFISMLFPLVTTAYFYAYEARPHGIVLGFGGIALLCWQGANGSKQRGRWLIGLFVALMGAILTHTYAILLIVPFALAELVRSIFLRRVDWPICLTLLSSASGAIVSLPLFRAAKVGIFGMFPATKIELVKTYQSHLEPAVSVLAAALILYFIFTFAAPNPPPARSGARSLELPEVVVLVAFVAMPFFTYILAKLTGAPFFYRYSISIVIGLGCLLGILTAKRPPVALGLLLFLVAQIGINLLTYARSIILIEPIVSLPLSISAAAFAEKYEVMESILNINVPIVLTDELAFLPIIHYAPPHLGTKLVYLVSPGDINGEGYIRLKQLGVAPGRFEKQAEFLSTHDAFIVHCTSRSITRLKFFIDGGADVKMIRISSSEYFFLISLKNTPRELSDTPIR